MRSSLQRNEEQKQPDFDFSSVPNPLEEFKTLMTPQEMMMMFMGNYPMLNHMPKKLHDFLKKKKQDYDGQFKLFAIHTW